MILDNILINKELAQMSNRCGNTVEVVDLKNFYNDDLKVEYVYNSYGYRSEEFKSDNEILVLGCSQTFGVGLPQIYTWSNILSNFLEKKYSNLALPGDSIQGQTCKAFKYFEEFGNPKIIVGCFPLFRIDMPEIIDDKSIEIKTLIFEHDYIAPISKKPHALEYVIPKEATIFNSFMLLKILQQYCKTNNIIFIWDIWESSKFFEDFYDKNKNLSIFNNRVDDYTYKYIEGDNDKNGNLYYENKLLECHDEIKDHPLFKRASDSDNTFDKGHFGIHKNIHIAELFLSKYRKLKNV